MKLRISAVFAAGLIVLGTGVQAWAHHSFAAEYDMKQPITVHGAIVQVRLENPHSSFVVDVKDAATGKVDRWSFEAGTPSGMIRNGYRPGIIKPGDEVTIKGFRSKDSDTRGMLESWIRQTGTCMACLGPGKNH